MSSGCMDAPIVSTSPVEHESTVCVRMTHDRTKASLATAGVTSGEARGDLVVDKVTAKIAETAMTLVSPRQTKDSMEDNRSPMT